ncbi:flagellar biosynthesis protein FlhF [Noviherbaspirillum sp.]|uniref:flagellar biosynthesis protein FlhF n=1 Tax=Noviherbaspirillum sp. TaxID=1926288 RepID=UPI002FE1FFE0
MNVKKFSASTSRDAWRQVREALGPDAVILSNRTINGMVEILALAGEDMSSLAEPAVEKEALSQSTLAALTPKQRPESGQAAGLAGALAAARQQSNPQEAATASASAELAQVMSEIRSMRGMLEAQLTEIAWGSQQKREPAKGLVMREMLAAGFSASLARYLVEKLPAGEKPEGAMNWIKSVLTRNLAVVDNEAEIMGKGGVFALVGPTGVGKTTTTAKLAARCVMRHGAGKLALITTDGYRIGGYEQLRIYGKILGVMVHSVKDETDLRIALDEMKNKHTVLIDTVGMGQRDKMVAEQIAMLSGAGTKVKRLLCLSATSSGETLNEVVRSYQGSGLAGCIMTKLDEAATIGSLLDVAIRQKLSLYYVANGQRVPEDLHVANQHYLVDRAFKLKRETAPFLIQDSELPMVMANTARSMNDNELREVRIG